MKRKRLLASALPAMLFATTAYAVRQPDYLAERPIETAHGERGRVTRPATMFVPSKAAVALRAFTDAHGAWTAQWDADTGVPTWMTGKGIAAPGANADDAIAERAARDVLAEAIGLIAPGARVDDFAMTRNVARGAVRTVAFQQTWQGLDVWGGHLLFMFKNDRLFVINSTASPNIGATMPATVVSGADLTTKAVGWITGGFGATPKVLDTGAPMLLPILRDRGVAVEHRVVVPVTVDLTTPRAQWTVFVDAGTGEPLARRQRLAFGSGSIRYHVPDRYPGGGYADYAAPFAFHKLDNTTSVLTDGDGVFSWPTEVDQAVTPGLTGSKIRVSTATGTAATASLMVSPTTGAAWDLSADERADAQLNAFIHANRVKAYIKANMDPDLPWLDAVQRVVVNEDDVCNAYSNLDDIHFFLKGEQQGTTCENTGRMADVVYHETGHSLHCQAMQDRLGIDCEQSFDGGISEGVADYLAATITDDSSMGIGFFSNGDGPLRELDPANAERRYPDDVSESVHDTGLIIGGTLWDLRKALVAELGAAEGVALTDDIFYGIISSGTDLAGTFAVALATDDDDGDLSNGTPHQCAITEAFRLHGLTEVPGAPGALAPPVLDGLSITMAQPTDDGSDCPAPALTGATATWRLAADRTVTGTVELEVGATELTGALPTPDSTGVIEYQLSVTRADGQARRYPENIADGWYQTYVGPVTELYCTDFEADPTDDGWTLAGRFAWGAPAPAPGATDPAAAFSGTNVLGQNLSGNYSSDDSSNATSPVIDVTGYTNVRIQYRRWLGSEDAEYDVAQVVVDGEQVWKNLRTTDGDVQHVDAEWRFHDVDITAQAADGSVQIAFEHSSDQALEFGGWSVDDFCVVAVAAGGLTCGDGALDDAEQCDDGNAADGDGCSSACLDESSAGGCCSTGGDGSAAPLVLGFLTFAGVGLGRRRRR